MGEREEGGGGGESQGKAWCLFFCVLEGVRGREERERESEGKVR